MPIQPPARQGSSVHKTLTALRDGERSKLDLIEAGAGNRRWLENLLSQLHVAALNLFSALKKSPCTHLNPPRPRRAQ